MKNKKGISLVALIITIIVMVILAGIIITAAVADGGIIDRAQVAKRESERVDVQEIIIGSYVFKVTASNTANYKYLDLPKTVEAIYDNLTANKYELKSQDGIVYDTKEKFVEAQPKNADGEIEKISLEIQGKHGEYKGTVTEEGLQEDIEEIIGGGEQPPIRDNDTEITEDDIIANYEKYLKLAREKGQVTDINIGIGTDGELVNLDLWNYFTTDDGAGKSLGGGEGSNIEAAYNEENIDNGQIQGKFPQYIFIKDEMKMYSVTELNSIFGYYKEGEGVEQIPEIPSTVKVIGDRAFAETILKSVTIPDSVEVIEDYAFMACYELETVNLSNNLKVIGQSAFDGCEKLNGIVLPSTLERIEDCSFYDCKSLSSINIPKNVTKVGYAAFRNDNLLLEIYMEHEKFDDINMSGLFYDKVPTRKIYFKNNEALESFENKYKTIFEWDDDVYDTGYGELKIKE